MAKTKYSPKLTLSPSTVAAGEQFTVQGSGFDPNFGNVVLGFTGGSWGSAINADGTFEVTGIPALSGDTLPDGEYPVNAYQNTKGNATLEKVATVELTVKS